MSVLAGYFDDSGTHASSEWVVVSGAVASTKQWEKLSRGWLRELESWKLEKGYFRMADFVNGTGEYSSWSAEKRAARLGRLVEKIRCNVRILVGNAVKQADFDEAYRRCPCTSIGTAYRFCAFLIVPAVNAWREKSPNRKPVALTFESGNKLLNEYGKILAQMGTFDSSREKFGIASLDQGHKKDSPALQAADLIAYATYKCLVERKITPEYLEVAFKRLFEIKHDGIAYGNPDLIEKYLQRINDGFANKEEPGAASLWVSGCGSDVYRFFTSLRPYFVAVVSPSRNRGTDGTFPTL